jgi:hypothetical protein
MLRLVHKFQQAYDDAARNDKSVILEDIIGQIRSNGGKFMENLEESTDTTKSCWQEVSHETAYKKVSHAFRSNRKVQLQHSEQQHQPMTKKQKNGKASKKSKNSEEHSQQYNMAAMGMPPMGNAGFPFFAPGMGFMPGFMPPGPWVAGGGPMSPELAQAQHAFWQQQQAIMMGNTGTGDANPALDPAATPGISSENGGGIVKEEGINVEAV